MVAGTREFEHCSISNHFANRYLRGQISTAEIARIAERWDLNTKAIQKTREM